MENSYRLKIKIGPHEFDADGPAEAVQEQFRIFKEMITSAPGAPLPQTQNTHLGNGTGTQTVPPRTDMALLDSSLGKITKLEDRTVSLTVRPQSINDAVLLLLYSQKTLRENDAVTGAEIMNG